jgi:hypothetical protein
MNKFKTEEFLSYLNKINVKYTIDTNPSDKKIARIKHQIENNSNKKL